MGVVVNRPSEFTLGDVFEQMGIETDDDELAAQPVLAGGPVHAERGFVRSEEHTSELQSLMRISYGVFCLNTKRVISDTQPRRGQPRHAVPAVADLTRDSTRYCFMSGSHSPRIQTSVPRPVIRESFFF